MLLILGEKLHLMILRLKMGCLV